MKLPIYLLPAISTLTHASIPQNNAQHPISSPNSPSSDKFTTTSRLLSLHRALCTISSTSGHEETVTTFLAHYLDAHNLTTLLQPVHTPSYPLPRHNLLAFLGKSNKTRTLVTSHYDTVPPHISYSIHGDPSNGSSEIWGRGTVDAKGSIAAQVTAYLDLLEAERIREGDVGLLFVPGEETYGDGMKRANDLDLSWETVIFGEPTELKLASGHKGIAGITLTAKGKAGHSGYPELGKNANDILIKVLAEMMRMDWPRSEKYGNTTINVGLLEGGVAANVIAEKAMAKIAIRIADGDPEEVVDGVQRAITTCGVEDDVVLEFGGGYGPVDVDADVPGFDTIVVNYGTDIPNLKGDHKRYLYGPGDILVAHSDHEHLTVEDLETAVEGYKKLILYSLR